MLLRDCCCRLLVLPLFYVVLRSCLYAGAMLHLLEVYRCSKEDEDSLEWLADHVIGVYKTYGYNYAFLFYSIGFFFTAAAIDALSGIMFEGCPKPKKKKAAQPEPVVLE